MSNYHLFVLLKFNKYNVEKVLLFYTFQVNNWTLEDNIYIHS